MATSVRLTRAQASAKEIYMKLISLLGIAAIGGFFYAHKRRGGEMTLESIADTARTIFGKAKVSARDLYAFRSNSERAYDGDNADLRH
jgi:hypothetical protein